MYLLHNLLDHRRRLGLLRRPAGLLPPKGVLSCCQVSPLDLKNLALVVVVVEVDIVVDEVIYSTKESPT